MASAGGHCEHVNHVSTQLPYALVVAAVCMVGYLLIGILQAAKLAALSWLALPVCIVLLFVILMLIRADVKRFRFRIFSPKRMDIFKGVRSEFEKPARL